jgi:hypothetical protein
MFLFCSNRLVMEIRQDRLSSPPVVQGSPRHTPTDRKMGQYQFACRRRFQAPLGKVAWTTQTARPSLVRYNGKRRREGLKIPD